MPIPSPASARTDADRVKYQFSAGGIDRGEDGGIGANAPLSSQDESVEQIKRNILSQVRRRLDLGAVAVKTSQRLLTAIVGLWGIDGPQGSSGRPGAGMGPGAFAFEGNPPR